MENQEFEQIVIRALASLPKHIRDKIDNVAFCIEDRPTALQLRAGGVKAGATLLGLYEGVPQIVYARGQMTRLPDKITIFKDSIEQFAHTSEEIEAMVRDTVWHEVAHHFGFDEHGARKLDSKRKRKTVEL
jgi:predicted Zn-dependent protease with MMP-like domain